MLKRDAENDEDGVAQPVQGPSQSVSERVKRSGAAHVSSLVEEECCVTCFASSGRRMLCHMFRF